MFKSRSLLLPSFLFLFALPLFTGCDTVQGVVGDQYIKLRDYLRDKTVLQRANVQLDDAKKSRAKLQDVADKFDTDAEVELRQVKRLEEEAGKTEKTFAALQDVAKKAGLPKLIDAKPEDKAKQISFGGKNLTGSDVYHVLKEYKKNLKKASDAIARGEKKALFLKDRAEFIENSMGRIDDNIAEMERHIEDFEMYRDMLAANKQIDALGLSYDKVNQLLNTESITSELQKKVDQMAVGTEKHAKSRLADDLRNIGIGEDSVTGDDLL
jgi:hypothetical protein